MRTAGTSHSMRWLLPLFLSASAAWSQLPLPNPGLETPLAALSSTCVTRTLHPHPVFLRQDATRRKVLWQVAAGLKDEDADFNFGLRS